MPDIIAKRVVDALPLAYCSICPVQVFQVRKKVPEQGLQAYRRLPLDRSSGQQRVAGLAVGHTLIALYCPLQGLILGHAQHHREAAPFGGSFYRFRVPSVAEHPNTVPDQIIEFIVCCCTGNSGPQSFDVSIVNTDAGIGSISDPCFSVLLHTKPVIHLRHFLAGHGLARLGSGRAGGQGQFLFSRGDQGHELRHLDVMPARRLPSISAHRGTQL